MNDLDRALVDIRELRRQVAETSTFRGYGPWTLWVTAAFALAAGFAQAAWVANPEAHPLRYAAIWSATAILSASLIGVQALTRAHREHSAMAGDMIRMAAEQFAPAALAGTLLTVVVIRSDAHILWLLPGLWQIVYSLGVFASCRFLPKPMRAAGVWYLLMGLLAVAIGNDRALSPALMAVSYAIGQSMIGVILYMNAKDAVDEE